MAVETIDMTPTWQSLLPALFAAIEDGRGMGRQIAKEEIARLAKSVDESNARAKRTHERPKPNPLDLLNDLVDALPLMEDEEAAIIVNASLRLLSDRGAPLVKAMTETEEQNRALVWQVSEAVAQLEDASFPS